MDLVSDIPVQPVEGLGERLEFAEPLAEGDIRRGKALIDWRKEDDDSPILRYIYRNFRPRKHLEFGTWKGHGVVECVESCNATVWTINLLEGEIVHDGSWAYSENVNAGNVLPTGAAMVPINEERVSVRTDAFGAIGHMYLQAGYGCRVCQIYADSRDWDTSAYPDGFFDTCLIDGGHDRDVVVNDMHKAIPLLRPGGLLMLHDFCPTVEVVAACTSPRGVIEAVEAERDFLNAALTDLFWIEPSWLLLGVRR